MNKLATGVFLCVFCITLSLPASSQSLHDLTDRQVSLSTPRLERAGKQAELTFASERVSDQFDGVVVQGFASDGHVNGWIRFNQGDSWGPWLELYIVTSATDGAFMAAYRGSVLRLDTFFEIRLSTEAPEKFTLIGAGVFDSRTDRKIETAPGHTPEPLFKSSDLIVPPILIRRAEWGANDFVGDPIPLARPTYDYITFHHAAGFSATTRDEGLEQVRRIQDFHQNGRGWSDIGYHFVLDKSGNLYQGRPFLDENVPWDQGPPLVQGAHAGGHNTGNIGVCLLGCYHPPAGSYCTDEISETALDSLVTVFAFLSERYGVSPQNIRGHRDFGSTACPGDNNYALLSQIQERVQELLLVGNRPLGAATLAATSDESGVVHLSWEFLEDQGIATYVIERVYPNDTTVVYEGTGAVPATFTDAGVERAGNVVYRLMAHSGSGRSQVLATAQLTLHPPEQSVLTENFPNPFTESTTIRYYLDQEGIVRLTIHDLTGREIERLVDAYQEGGRWYRATLDGAGLASGAYVYRLQVTGFAGVAFDETRTVVFVK